MNQTILTILDLKNRFNFGSEGSPKFLIGILITFIFAGIVYRFYGFDKFAYTIWADRDLIRGTLAFTDFPVLGSELYLTNGARIPGGFMYYLTYFILKIESSPIFFYLTTVVLDILSLLLVIIMGVRYFSPLVALAAGAVYALSPNVIGSISTIWNPSFLPIMATLCTFFMFKVLVDKNLKFLPPFVASVFIGLQFHLSLLSFIPLFFICLLVCPVKIGLRPALSAVMVALFLAFPYLLAELGNSFSNTGNIFRNNTHTIAHSNNPVLQLYLVVWQSLIQVRDQSGVFAQLGNYFNPVDFIHLFWNEATAFMRLNFAMIIGFLIFFVNTVRTTVINRDQGENSDKKHRALRVLLVIYGVGIVFATLFSSGASSVEGRYVIPILPVTVLLIGLLISKASQFFLDKKNVVLKTSGALTLGMLFIGMAYWWSNAYTNFQKKIYVNDTWKTSHFRYHVLSDLVDSIQEEFGFDDQKMETRVSFSNPAILEKTDNDNLLAVSRNTFSAFSYLLRSRHFSKKNLENSYSGCALVVLEPTENERIRLLSKVKQVEKIGSHSVIIERAFERSDFLVLGYSSLHGNCFRSITNPYHLSIDELAINTEAFQLPNGAAKQIKNSEASVKSYILRVASPAANFGGTDLAAKVSVETRKTGESRALIESGQLKGFLLTPMSTDLWNSKLVFNELTTGNKVELPLFEESLGGISLYLAPWYSKWTNLPKGHYLLEFSGIATASREDGRKVVEGNPGFSVVLDEEFIHAE